MSAFDNNISKRSSFTVVGMFARSSTSVTFPPLILLEDGISFLLLEDGSNGILIE